MFVSSIVIIDILLLKPDKVMASYSLKIRMSTLQIGSVLTPSALGIDGIKQRSPQENYRFSIINDRHIFTWFLIHVKHMTAYIPSEPILSKIPSSLG